MKKEVIALDIGGTNIRVAVVLGKKVTYFSRFPTPHSKDSFLSLVSRIIQERISSKTKGIGIAFPGQVYNGFVSCAPNLPLNNCNLKKLLEKRFGIPVKIHNDAGCVAIAESKQSSKKKNLIILTLGTGIGGGLVIEGNEFRGSGLGAEVGHMIIRGRFLESLWKNTKMIIKKKFNTELISDVAKKNSSASKAIIDDISDYLGQGVASLITVLDPDEVILAGGVRECKKKLLKPLQKSVKKYSFLTHKTPIRWTKLKEPGIIGASLLV